MKPILFELGPIVIRSWGVMVALAFIVSLYYVQREAARNDIEGDKIINLGFYVLLAGLLGARIIYVATDFNYFIAQPVEIIMINQGGMSIHGAILGGTIATMVFARYQKIPFVKMADIIAPALLLGQAIGRLGCFLTGICYGKITNFFINVKFPMLEGLRHPVQLYESGLNILAFGLIVIFRKRFKKDGTLFAVVLITYSSIRLITDFIRDGNKISYAGLSYAQIASLAAILVFSIMLVKAKTKTTSK